MRASTVWQGRRPPLQWRSPNPRRAGVVYDADVVAWDAAVVAAGGAAATASRKALLTTLVEGLKADGVWTSLDGLGLWANENVTQGRVDLRAPSRVATITGAGFTFTADRGMKGPGSAVNWISTGFDPTVGTNGYVRNSNSKGVYVRTASTTGATPQISQDSGIYDIFTSRVDGTNIQYANNAGSADLVAHGGNTTGHFHVDRSASNLTTLYRNGSSIDTFAGASVALPSVAISLFAYPGGGNYDDAQLSAHWYGASLGAAGALALYTRLQTYLTAVGA